MAGCTASSLSLLSDRERPGRTPPRTSPRFYVSLLTAKLRCEGVVFFTTFPPQKVGVVDFTPSMGINCASKISLEKAAKLPKNGKASREKKLQKNNNSRSTKTRDRSIEKDAKRLAADFVNGGDPIDFPDSNSHAKIFVKLISFTRSKALGSRAYPKWLRPLLTTMGSAVFSAMRFSCSSTRQLFEMKLAPGSSKKRWCPNWV